MILNKLQTSGTYYNRIGYAGEVGAFAMNNLYIFHPYTSLVFNKKLTVNFDYAAFWRYSLVEDLYAPPVVPAYPSVNDSRFAAHLAGMTVEYQANKYLNLKIDHNTVFPGTFLKRQNKGDNIYYFRFGAEYKF